MKRFVSQIFTASFIVGLLLVSANCRPNSHREDSNDTIQLAQDTIKNDSVITIYELEIPFMEGELPSQILKRFIYTSSYNHETRCPNWVAWVLTRELLQGEIDKRIWYDENGYAIGINGFNPGFVKGTYILDNEAEDPRPEFDDWDSMPSGMSHGHMCPAADCKISKVAMNQSFLLTNLCVQAEKLNTGSWNKLEMSCRDWANKYGRLYIVTGPIFNDNKVTKRMGNIAIPDSFYKVILCMEDDPKAIGFVFHNNDGPHNRAKSVCSVDSVEILTGIDFFPQLPNDIEEKIESQYNYQSW